MLLLHGCALARLHTHARTACSPPATCPSPPFSPKRIVNVSSSAHMFGKMDFDDLMGDRSYQPW